MKIQLRFKQPTVKINIITSLIGVVYKLKRNALYGYHVALSVTLYQRSNRL